MKKISAAIIAVLILLLAIVPVFAADYPSPTQEFFVNDFAGCINDSDKAQMQQMAEKLYKETGGQVVCVTVESLGGESVREYGLNLARQWGIGQSDKDNGILLLLSTGDRQIDIEVGYGLEGAITDGKTGRILDTYAVPYLKQNDYSTALRQSFEVLVNETATELGQTVEGYTQVADTQNDEMSSFRIFSVMFIMAIIIVAILYFAKRNNAVSGYDNGDFSDNNNHGGPFIGGFGGGFGGGSGGGGFSGGGGSFGGGGGSRGF